MLINNLGLQVTVEMITSWLGAGLLGILDGVQGGANVAVLGLKEACKPAALIAETHGEHQS